MRRSARLRSYVLAALRTEFRRETVQTIEVPPVGPEILVLMQREAHDITQQGMIELRRSLRRERR